MVFEKRDCVKNVILSLVTCGIYGWVWIFKMAKEAVSVKDENDAGTLEAILMIFLPFIGFYLAEKKFAEGCQARGIEHKENSIMYLLLAFIPYGWLVDCYLMQTELNKLADMFNPQA